ncbi:MAG: sigma-70 family RNA polymerase sigma factor [Microbacteriaceae bacterium]
MKRTGQDYSDSELIEQSRNGSGESYAELWRRHQAAGLRVARTIAGDRVDPEDLLSDAFTEILRTLRSGKGPTDSFRPYLYTVIKNLSIAQTSPVDNVDPIEFSEIAADEQPDPLVAALEQSITGKAFAALPERWQAALWYAEVEGMKPREMGPLLGLKANAVSALVFRAREGLRQAWFKASYGGSTLPQSCAEAVSLIELRSRKTLNAARTSALESHLEYCTHCQFVAEESEDAKHRLGALLLPLLLGTGAASQLVFPMSTFSASAASSGIFAEGNVPKASQKATQVAAIATVVALAVAGAAIAVPLVIDAMSPTPTPTPTVQPSITPPKTPAPTPTASPEPEEPVVEVVEESPVITDKAPVRPRPKPPVITTPPIVQPDTEAPLPPTFLVEEDPLTTRVLMRGNGEPGAQIEVRTVNGGIVLGRATVLADGTWVTEETLRGANPVNLAFEIVQIDAAGNESAPAAEDPVNGNILNHRGYVLNHSIDLGAQTITFEVTGWIGSKMLITKVASPGPGHTVLSSSEPIPASGTLSLTVPFSAIGVNGLVEFYASYDGLPTWVGPGPAYPVTIP